MNYLMGSKDLSGVRPPLQTVPGYMEQVSYCGNTRSCLNWRRNGGMRALDVYELWVYLSMLDDKSRVGDLL